MTTARDALQRLREGNRRYASGRASRAALAGCVPGAEAPETQRPCAVILGCSDSRVPVEIIFDQGPGDLFVIRVAGNVVAPSQVASAEFAADKLETRLVVVLGHSDCGAVHATLAALEAPREGRTLHLPAILERIRPAVEPLLDEPGADHEALVDRAVRANVRIAADRLRHGSALLEDLAENQGLVVVGAEYSLRTGEVDFFDGLPDGW